MEKVANNKELRRQRLYQNHGKKEKAIKAYSKVFQECFWRMDAESYSSIHTLSILRYENIAKTGNLTLLLKEPRELSKMETNALNLIYKRIRKELGKEYNISKGMEKEFQLMKNIAEWSFRLIENDDIQLLTQIEIAQSKLEKLLSKEKKGLSLIEQCVALEKICKVTIDVDKCSVAKFFGYINMAEKLTNG